MVHTFAQAFGSVVALCGAWLVWGPAGLAVIAGLVLVLGSLIVESSRPTRKGD